MTTYIILVVISILCFIASIVLQYKVIPDEKDESKSKNEKVFREVFFWAGVILALLSYHYKDDAEMPKMSFLNRYRSS